MNGLMWILLTLHVNGTSVEPYYDGYFPNQTYCEREIMQRERENMQGQFFCLQVKKHD